MMAKSKDINFSKISSITNIVSVMFNMPKSMSKKIKIQTYKD